MGIIVNYFAFIIYMLIAICNIDSKYLIIFLILACIHALFVAVFIITTDLYKITFISDDINRLDDTILKLFQPRINNIK